MAVLPFQVASSYNPLSGLVGGAVPPGAGPRSSGTPTAPGLGAQPSGSSFTPASAPGGITVGGTPGIPGTPAYTPDYGQLIQGDPGLLQAEADLQGSGVANQAQRDAAFQRGIINYGQLPDLNKAASSLGLSAGDLQSILGPNTGQLAQENTNAGTSILARLNADNAKTIQGIKNSLAARGLFRSGETGYQLGQQNQAYTNSQSDALKSLLDSLSGAQGSYVQSEQQREMALAQAASDAANRAYQNYPGSPGIAGTAGTAGTTANWVGNDTAGNPVYQDPTGQLWNPDGTNYSGPTSAGAIGLGTGPNRLSPQTPQFVQNNTQRYGI